jgi:predicted metal-dependent enzyme (double-stranded beta helix superfamily)
MTRPIDQFVHALGAALDETGGDPARRAATLLRPWLGRDDFLGGCDCSPRADRYARRLIHADPRGRFSVLALVWSPGQASPIHAHHAWCALGIHCGALQESFFDLPSAHVAPALSGTLLRAAGSCSHGEARPDLIHRIANAGDATAVSVHVYGVPADAVDHGVNRIYA